MRGLLFALLGLGVGWAVAVRAADVPLPDAEAEARAHALFYELRCVVCEGEPIAESPVEVAAAIRAYVRQRIAAGEGDEAIKAALAARYGESILMSPRFGARTWLLWLNPLLVLLLGAAIITAYYAAMRTAAPKNPPI